MIRYKTLFIISRLFIASALLISASLCSFADERELNVNASDKIDAVLVLDTSGSMLITDPLKLRAEGAKLLVQFLKAGDRLSIVTFAEKAEVIRTLSDYDPSQQEQVGKAISSTENTGLYTNLYEGIRLAQTVLQNNMREGVTPAIVLMSDGKMEPNPTDGSPQILTDQLVEHILPELKKSGIKVYTLNFSDQADKDFLQEIAALTDGISWHTPTADKIHESFANLFLAVKKPQVVPQTKRGFKLDKDVQEATFYINREEAVGEIVVTGPDGRQITPDTTDPDIKWFRGQKFDVVTIQQPKPGDWQISGVTNNDGFATVLTNVKLLTEWPSNINAEEEVLLQARLYEAEKPIALPEMSGVIKYAFQITPTDKISEPIIREYLYDDGTHGDKIEKDGIFSAKVLLVDPGEYKLRVLAKAPTFERNQQIPFRVKPALISLSVIDVEEAVHHAPQGEGEGHGHEEGDQKPPEDVSVQQYFRVELADDVLSFKKSDVRLIAVDDKHLRYELPLEQSKTNRLRYETPASALPHDGEYTIQATLTGETKRGTSVRTQSKTAKYERIKTKHEPEKIVSVVVEKPKEEVPPSVVIPIILMTLLQGGICAALFMMLKKMSIDSGNDAGAPVFASLDPIRNAVEKLKAQAALMDLDLTLPIFSDPNYQLQPVWLGGAQGLVRADSATTSEEAVKADPDDQQTPAAVEDLTAGQSEAPTEEAAPVDEAPKESGEEEA